MKTATILLLLAFLLLLFAACAGQPVPPATSVPTAAPTTTPTEKTVSDIDLETGDGVRIRGTHYAPGLGQAPGVVLLHMLGRQRSDWDAFARQLQEAGYAVLAIDLRGHGESEGRRDWQAMTQDAESAIAYLRSRPEIDGDRIALIGASIGANIVLNAAANDPQIKGAALLSPGLDYRGVTTEDAVKMLGDRPLLIVASEEDSYAADSARTLADMADSAQLLMLSQQGHGTRMLGKDNGLESAILDWLRQTLTAD
jgi:pimeloyl-ACP methyl ester carboxylesterase